MTARQESNRILSAEALQISTVCSSTRSTIQTKAKPSLQTGAGGVGGLVAVSIDGDYYFPGYDNNGNVVGYWDESGSIVAEHAYDAFGNTISSSGSMASVFPHRFSTKYYDAETDLYYYGYRYYSPSLGRWISRDPIGEDGGLNLVSFCNNGPLSVFDYLGTLIIVFSGGGGNDTADVVADTQNQFESAKNDIETFAENIEKYVSEDRYSDLQTLNKVSFNNIPFPGTRTQYLKKIRREKQSFFQPCVDNSIDAYIRRIATSAARYVREPYDMVGVSIHGQDNSTATAPTDMVVLEGPAGQDIIPQIAFYRQLSGVLSRIKFSGQLVIVSCFQEYHTSYPPDIQEDARMMSSTREQFSYSVPDFYPKLDSIERFKERAFCALRFTPFFVSRSIGGR